MLTLIVCAYIYFTWLFTGHIPMEHLADNQIWVIGLLAELFIEAVIISAIVQITVEIK